MRSSSIEPLESRYAPALVLVNPLADIVAGAGKTGANVELGQMLDPFEQHPGRTLVKFTLNLDMDPATPGIQPDTDPNTPGDQLPTVVFELFDDDAPLTVQNFLRYAVNSTSAAQFTNDYTGTFLHRMFDFGSGSSAGIDIVQGGGFNTTAITTHIPTFATVHNEYSAAHPNTRGTIAMAKTGVSPNTGSSEWFVNTTDNTSTLGAGNNGGFTVFGQVISGIELFDKIAALQKIDAIPANPNDPLSDLPVQNYSAAAGVKTDNLITITSVEVTPPVARAGATAGQTFEVISITDPSTGQPSTVVTTPNFILPNSTLPLSYAAGKAGIADVTVRVTQGVETLDETFRVTVLPNLIASAAADTLPNIVVPGDVVKTTVKLSNTGGGHFTGPVKVNLYLSPSTAADPSGYNINGAEDIAIGSFPVQAVNVASDGSATITGSVTINARLDRAEGAYRLLAEVLPQSGSTSELFTDDNAAQDGGLHAYTNSFGVVSVIASFGGSNFNFGTRLAKLSYTEADNNVVTLSLTGAGVGRVSQNDGGVNVFVSGTNSASVVNLAAVLSSTNTTPAHAALHHIDIANTLGTLNFGSADIDGYITISNGIKVANFGNVTGNDRTLVLGAFGALNTAAATLNFARVTDLNIESDQPIAALTAIDWLDTNAKHNRIVTPSLSKLSVRGNTAAAIAGDFEADIDILRTNSVASIAVKGFLRDSTITTPGNVGAVSLGGMIDSNLFAGTTARPDAPADFTAKRTISSFTINGVPNGGDVFFADSQVAASTIAKIVVKKIDGDSGAGSFGFVADTVLSYLGPTDKLPRLNLTKAATIDVRNHYSLTIL